MWHEYAGASVKGYLAGPSSREYGCFVKALDDAVNRPRFRRLFGANVQLFAVGTDVQLAPKDAAVSAMRRRRYPPPPPALINDDNDDDDGDRTRDQQQQHPDSYYRPGNRAARPVKYKPLDDFTRLMENSVPASKLVTRMIEAAQVPVIQNNVDARGYQENMYTMFSEVMRNLGMPKMHEVLIAAGILCAVSMWLYPHNNSLPRSNVIEALIHALSEMDVSVADLETTTYQQSEELHICKTLVKLRDHPRISIDNARAVRRLLNRWVRMTLDVEFSNQSPALMEIENATVAVKKTGYQKEVPRPDTQEGARRLRQLDNNRPPQPEAALPLDITDEKALREIEKRRLAYEKAQRRADHAPASRH